jgi:glutathione S-transferase
VIGGVNSGPEKITTEPNRMLLHDGGRAPNPRRVRIFLAEKAIAVPMAHLDMAKLEHTTPEFTAKNPLQRLPALELDDGTVITESMAICRYFEELQPNPPLFGRNPKDKALVEMWSRRIELGLYASLTAVFRHGHPAMAEREKPQVPEWASANRDKVEGHLRFLDEQLARHEFVAGDFYSVADITGLVTVDFVRITKIAIPEECTHLRRWHAAMLARPSANA